MTDTKIDVQIILDTYAKHGTLSSTYAVLDYSQRTIRKVLIENDIDVSNGTNTSDIDEEAIIKFYNTNEGSKRATQAEFKIGFTRLNKILKKHRVDLPVKGGRISYREPTTLDLPEEGEVNRYILTSAQNNTPVHEQFWENLLAASDDLQAEIMVSRYTYNKGSYSNAKSIKVGTGPSRDDLAECWYDERLEPYFCDGAGRPERYRLAPGLVWCSEQNILPTNARPLMSLEGYTRRESGIFPHAKLAMESVASLKHEATKFNWTTGTVTQRNYIQKSVGLKAEFFHSYCALLIEVDSEGNWWVRQLEADESGTFYDLDKCFKDGKSSTYDAPAAVNWGDVHASEADPIALDVANEILDELKPKRQFLHDLLSFRSRSHHEMKSFSRMYAKHVNGEESVDGENRITADVANDLHRDWIETYVVNSNHDRHGERWLDEADYKKDPINARHFLEATLERMTHIEDGTPWQYSEWALRRAGILDDIVFLEPDQPFEILGIEYSLHGDEGPNGARGSTRNLTKLGRKITKGHDHKATIDNDVWSTGACQLDFAYMSGPSGHSVTHVLAYPNGSRTMLTMWNGRWRA